MGEWGGRFLFESQLIKVERMMKLENHQQPT